MTDFIAVLNYEHLDNGLFLTSFAKALQRRKKRGIILHEDSEYTERIIQTGVMRYEATIRCYKDLNHRLVALFADEGISTIGLNGFQKNLIRSNENGLNIDFHTLEKLPVEPMILISAVGVEEKNGKPVPVSISDLAFTLQNHFIGTTIDLFSIKEQVEILKNELPRKLIPELEDHVRLTEHLPKNFKNFGDEVMLHSTNTF